MRLLAPVLAIATIPLLGILALQHEQRANEARLAAVASQIARREVDVHCPGLIEKLVESPRIQDPSTSTPRADPPTSRS